MKETRVKGETPLGFIFFTNKKDTHCHATRETHSWVRMKNVFVFVIVFVFVFIFVIVFFESGHVSSSL